MGKEPSYIVQYKVRAELSLRNSLNIADYHGLISVTLVANEKVGDSNEPCTHILITKWKNDFYFRAAAGKLENELPVLDRLCFGPTREASKASLPPLKRLQQGAAWIVAVISAVTLLITHIDTLFRNPSTSADFQLQLPNEGNVLRGESIKPVLTVWSLSDRNIRVRVQQARLNLKPKHSSEVHLVLFLEPLTFRVLPYKKDPTPLALALEKSQLNAIPSNGQYSFDLSLRVGVKAGRLRPEYWQNVKADGKLWPTSFWKKPADGSLIKEGLCKIITTFYSGIEYPWGIEVQASLPEETGINFRQTVYSPVKSLESHGHVVTWTTKPLKSFSINQAILLAEIPENTDCEEVAKNLEITFDQLERTVDHD